MLEKALFQAKHGNPDHFIISGERGIGKSSLLYYMTILAKGNISSLDDIVFRFLVLNIELIPTNTYTDIIKKVGAEFQREIAGHERAKELAKSVWDFLSRWQAFGISYKAPEKTESAPELLEDLIHTVSEVLARLIPTLDGLLLLIDEADKPAAEAHLGQFVDFASLLRNTATGCRFVWE